MSSVQTSGRIAAEDVSFQRTSNPNFNAALDETSTRILDLANQLLKSASRGSDLAAPKMTDIDDLDTKWSDTVEIVDFLLEKAVSSLVSHYGISKSINSFVLHRILAWMNTLVLSSTRILSRCPAHCSYVIPLMTTLEYPLITVDIIEHAAKKQWTSAES